MIAVVYLKEMSESIMKLIGSIEIPSGKNMSAGVFPEPPDNVEIGGIRWHEYEVDIEFKDLLHGMTMRVTGIVKNDGYQSVSSGKPDLLKECLCLPGIHKDIPYRQDYQNLLH